MLFTPEVKTKRSIWPMIAACALEIGTVLSLVAITAVATIPAKKKDTTPIVYFPEQPRVEIVKTVLSSEPNPFATGTGGPSRPTRVFLLPTGKADLNNLGNELPSIGDDERIMFADSHRIVPPGNIPDGIGTTIAPPPDTPVIAEKPVQRVRVGGQVNPPVQLTKANPVYPQLAKQARIQGTVKLQAVISTSGRILNLQLLSGHPLLVPAAVEAVRTWTYQPLRLNGELYEAVTTIEVNFTLSN